MNIGKLSFSEIIAVGFERRNVLFAAQWLFLLFFSSAALSILSAVLGSNGAAFWATAVDVTARVFAVIIAIVISLGAYALAKASIAKTKKVDPIAAIKALFWKTLGALIILILAAAVVLAAAYGIGFLVKVPYVGLPIMALLFVPAVAVFVLTSVFFLVGSKLLFAVLVDKPKASAFATVKSLWAITTKAPEKLFFNFVLSFLPIGFAALSIFVLLGVLATLPYLAFGWAFPLYPLLQFASQLGFAGLISYSISCALNYIIDIAGGFISVLVGLGFFGILSYGLAYVVSVSAAVYYSIYLDASKK